MHPSSATVVALLLVVAAASLIALAAIAVRPTPQGPTVTTQAAPGAQPRVHGRDPSSARRTPRRGAGRRTARPAARPTPARRAVPEAAGDRGPAAGGRGHPAGAAARGGRGRRYYRALDARRFDEAWTVLSPAVHAAFGGFERWRDGFATTLSNSPRDIEVAHEGAVVVARTRAGHGGPLVVRAGAADLRASAGGSSRDGRRLARREPDRRQARRARARRGVRRRVMMPRVPLEDAEPGELVAVGEAELARMRDRLAEIEAEYAMLEAELAVFQADYTREVVTVLAQLHDVEAQILALHRRPRAGAREARARARARRTVGGERASPRRRSPVPPASLKRLFRDAAKRMHPDLAPDAEAREHAEAFMKRLNDAYRAGDADAIADLVRQWDASPFAPGDRRRRARAASRRCRPRSRAPSGGSTSCATPSSRSMMERAMAAAAAGEDHVATLRAHAELALADARARLAALEAA